MRILKNRSNRTGKRLFAFGADMETFADFLGRIVRSLPDFLLVIVLAMRTNRTIRPPDAFKVFPRRQVGAETLVYLIQCQIVWCFHASNFAQQPTIVKCIIPVTSVTFLIIRHLTCYTKCYKVACRCYIVDSQALKVLH